MPVTTAAAVAVGASTQIMHPCATTGSNHRKAVYTARLPTICTANNDTCNRLKRKSLKDNLQYVINSMLNIR